jgi:hypothetical protein
MPRRTLDELRVTAARIAAEHDAAQRVADAVQIRRQKIVSEMANLWLTLPGYAPPNDAEDRFWREQYRGYVYRSCWDGDDPEPFNAWQRSSFGLPLSDTDDGNVLAEDYVFGSY